VPAGETMLGPRPDGYPLAARATRTRCPASSESLEYALEHVEPAGICGGSTADERSRMRAHRRRGLDRVRPSVQ
jgi:hypothetical protein